MKNVIFMMNVDCKGEGRYATERTHGYQYCEKSWREWADKHGFEVLVMHDPIHDNDEMSIGWQRYYIHDILSYLYDVFSFEWHNPRTNFGF